MAAYIFLALGLLCALIGRILLIGAAFRVSIWWGLGVFLPFGPLLFRLRYPDRAPLSKKFLLATLPCILLYFVLGGASRSRLYDRRLFGPKTHLASTPLAHYGLEAPDRRAKSVSASSGPVVELTPNLAERRTANAREFERLRAWSEKLRLQKRDLLHSDAEGNLVYNIELAQFSTALEKATAEKAQLGAK